MQINFSLLRLLSKGAATTKSKVQRALCSCRHWRWGALRQSTPLPGEMMGTRYAARHTAAWPASQVNTCPKTMGATTTQLPGICTGIGVTVAPSLGPAVEQAPRIPSKMMPVGARLPSFLLTDPDTGMWQTHFWIAAESELWMFMFFQHRKSPCECPALSGII